MNGAKLLMRPSMDGEFTHTVYGEFCLGWEDKITPLHQRSNKQESNKKIGTVDLPRKRISMPGRLIPIRAPLPKISFSRFFAIREERKSTTMKASSNGDESREEIELSAFQNEIITGKQSNKDQIETGKFQKIRALLPKFSTPNRKMPKNKVEKPTTEKKSNGEDMKQQDKDKIETSKVQTIQKDLFYFDELSLGNKLGQGCFGVVFEVQQFKPLADNDPKFDDDRLLARRYYANHNNQDPTGKCKYAVKCIREDFDTPRQFKIAARDMITEADLLSTIDHPRIVKMYAKSASGTKFMKCTKDNFQDFFIVIDVLSGTLHEKIFEWRLEKRRMATAPLFTKRPATESMKKKKVLVERLRVSYDIASAIAYLHGQSIVYRDLKADNVGFGVDGRCKLFDFGFARRLPDDPEKKMKNDTYVMSGKTGSMPHMAPEVWKEKPYNEKADLYSYAVLVWVILTLEMPYFEYARDMHLLAKRVMDEGHRPPINGKWPKKLQILLGKAWSEDMNKRPAMDKVCITLKEIIASELPKSEKTIRRSFF